MIFVFGNGLSIGFDRRLTTAALTDRVLASLGDTYAGVLWDLAEFGTPDDPDTAPVDVVRGGFEQLAGPLDRLADALVAMQRLFTGPGTSRLFAGLREAADGLRQHYVRIVGTVLSEVDACCVMDDADEERKASWRKMNAFAAELIKLHATMFTLNYDSLLMSALLEGTPWVYDGFRSGTLNVPLDHWSEPATLYHLHGSVAGRHAADGLATAEQELEQLPSPARAVRVLRPRRPTFCSATSSGLPAASYWSWSRSEPPSWESGTGRCCSPASTRKPPRRAGSQSATWAWCFWSCSPSS
jgi:hypothetical protein